MNPLPKLLTSETEAKKRISIQIEKGKNLYKYELSDEGFREAEVKLNEWDRYNFCLLEELFDLKDISNEYKEVHGWECKDKNNSERARHYGNKLKYKIYWLETFIGRLSLYNDLQIPELTNISTAVNIIENICKRFHTVAKQLKTRYSNRSTIKITDEYDVQDLLYALLRLFFEDIRKEDASPRYAGSSSRVDFLLKKEQIVIEVKMTREGLGDKEVGQQLIVDIERYKSHPDCKTLYCFVYDPNNLIENPVEIEKDLSREEDKLRVITLITPKTH